MIYTGQQRRCEEKGDLRNKSGQSQHLKRVSKAADVPIKNNEKTRYKYGNSQ